MIQHWQHTSNTLFSLSSFLSFFVCGSATTTYIVTYPYKMDRIRFDILYYTINPFFLTLSYQSLLKNANFLAKSGGIGFQFYSYF
jgi:hypothetical protein